MAGAGVRGLRPGGTLPRLRWTRGRGWLSDATATISKKALCCRERRCLAALVTAAATSRRIWRGRNRSRSERWRAALTGREGRRAAACGQVPRRHRRVLHRWLGGQVPDGHCRQLAVVRARLRELLKSGEGTVDRRRRERDRNLRRGQSANGRADGGRCAAR